MVFRAEVILAIAEGLSNKAVAERVDTRQQVGGGRFAQAGLSGLLDASRSGKPRQYQGEHERRILAALDGGLAAGRARALGRRLVGQASGRHLQTSDLAGSAPAVRIALARRRSWCISTDPAFAQKAAEIVGLYLQPPDNAVVISVDEKPHIQALERAQGWLKLPNGKAVTGFSHAYKRHGTTTLFAALDVATGLVKTGHYPAPPSHRVPGFHEPRGCRTGRPGDPCDLGQSQYPQAQTRPLAGSAQECPFPLRRPMPPGSIKWRYGSLFSPPKPWPARVSPRHARFAIRSTPLSRRITKPLTPSSGPSKSYSRSIHELSTLTYATRY